MMYESRFKQRSYFQVLNEFIVQEISWLKQYLNLSDDEKAEEILYSFSYLIDYFTDDIIYIAKRNNDEEMLSLIEEYEWDDVVTHLLNGEEYKEISNEIKEKVLIRLQSWSARGDIEYQEIPSWFYLEDPKVIKNQWLIHFTKDADILAKEGFNYLIDDVTKLGLTTLISKSSYDRSKKGYGFSYLIDDFEKYGKSVKNKSLWKYGKEAVLFRASGVRCWHNSDREYQTIFKGDTVRDIIPLTRDDIDFVIYNKKTGNQIFKHYDLRVVVEWLLKNYDQYRKVI